jgi:hypothetical protein
VAVLAVLVFSARGFCANLDNVAMSKFTHTFDIPFPRILHRILDEQTIDSFDEVIVIGDVHGCADELQALVHVVNEAPHATSKILKIFVGDLVNKGPKNCEVLDFMLMHKRDCISVRGNHDEVALREYFRFKKSGEQLEAKYRWAEELNEDQVNYLLNLPYTISMSSLTPRAVVVHAGLVPGLRLNDTNPLDLVSMRNLVPESGRDTHDLKPTKNGAHGEPWASLWCGPEHVYFGHDAIRKLQKYEHATGLDTGCVYGDVLTGVFIKGKRTNEFVQVKAARMYQQPSVKE